MSASGILCTLWIRASALRRRVRCRSIIQAAMIVFSAALAGATAACTRPTILGSVGLTENQYRTGEAVQTICGQCIAFGTSTSAALDLLQRCGNMVHNAKQTVGTGSTASLRGLTQDELLMQFLP